jgi:hypothetical protein
MEPQVHRALAAGGLRRLATHWCASAAIASIALVSCVGCGPHSDRLAISGTVKLDGVPLDAGSIRFTSLSENKAAAGAMIKDGAYEIPQEQGLLPGTYHVEITSPDTKSPPVIARATPGGPGMPVARERIPDDFNVDSKHSVNVTSDGDNHFEFEVVSRPKK